MLEMSKSDSFVSLKSLRQRSGTLFRDARLKCRGRTGRGCCVLRLENLSSTFLSYLANVKAIRGGQSRSDWPELYGLPGSLFLF